MKIFSTLAQKVPSVEFLHSMFVDINKSDKKPVPFTDTDFYAEQLENLYDLSEKDADSLANQLLKYSKRQ